MALNAIGTRAASLWLSAGPRAPWYAWAACIGLATQAISWPVPRVRRKRKTVARPDTPDSLCGWIDDDTNLHVWENLGVHGVWERYVDAWCRACESSLNFDVMAHPDLVMRFSKEGFAPDFDAAPFWEQMAEGAHDTGRSTAAPRKGLDDYYPSTGLLRCFAHAEVPITFGSDAHRACDICWNIRDAQAHAYDCGYRAFDIPHLTGEWESTPLA